VSGFPLVGARCLVRPWRAEDAQPLARHANNLNIARHLRDRFPHPYTIGDARAFLRFAAQSDDVANFAIEVDGEAAGGVGYNPGRDVERYSAEIGYWLSEVHWGRGIVTEAVQLLSEHLFRAHDMLRLFALPFADNAASIRVLEKAGYVREGLMRASAVKHGAPKDQVLLARVNPAWRLRAP
jgi:[ribosomal protein S5]-alanine N-acetyltransferase